MGVEKLFEVGVDGEVYCGEGIRCLIGGLIGRLMGC